MTTCISRDWTKACLVKCLVLLINCKTPAEDRTLYKSHRAVFGQKAILAMRSIAAVSWCWPVRGPLTLPNIIIQPGKWPQAVQIFHIIISTGVPYNHFHKSVQAYQTLLRYQVSGNCKILRNICSQIHKTATRPS